MLSSAQKETLQFLVQILNSNGVKFQVSGGLAAIAYGVKRPLYDIDLEIYEKDVEKVRELFKGYIVEDWNNELEGNEDQFDLWMMTLEVNGVPVDINQIERSRVRSMGGEWVNQPSLMEVELKIVDGVEVPVQNKTSLISYKKVLGRDTDLIDVEQMQRG